MIGKQIDGTKGLFLFILLIAFTFDSPPLEATVHSSEQDLVPLIINEVLARVPTDDIDTEEIEGDANGDGIRQASFDEFVELVNAGEEPLDVSGFEVDDNGGTRGSFFFPLGTVIPAAEAVVIFGGGDLSLSPLEFGNVRALGLVFTSGLAPVGFGFSNNADSLVVRDPLGQEVVRLDYDDRNPVPQPVFQSFNRNPDVSGPFDNHMQVPGAGERPFSPGTMADGRAFRRLISSLTPSSGPLSGNNQVVIDGAGFGTEVESVLIGGQQAQDINRVGPLQLIVTAPPASAAGTVDVEVTDQFGRIVAEGAYTYETSMGRQ